MALTAAAMTLQPMVADMTIKQLAFLFVIVSTVCGSAASLFGQDSCEGMDALRTTFLEMQSADWTSNVYLEYDINIDGNEKLNVRDVNEEFRFYAADDELRLVGQRMELHQTDKLSVRILPPSRTINIADGRPPGEKESPDLQQISRVLQDSILTSCTVEECTQTRAFNGRQAWKVKIRVSPRVRKALSGVLVVESLEYIVDAAEARLYGYRVNYEPGSRINSMALTIKHLQFDANRPAEWPDVDDFVYKGSTLRSDFVSWEIKDVRTQH